MDGDITILVATAFSVGGLHTLLGPDHYVPFVAMSKCNQWSAQKTLCMTTICGLGHVAGSVLIGAGGLAIGSALFQLESLESFRGSGASWMLLGFGLAYLTWGIVQAWRDVPHTHLHAHADGTLHSHVHRHDAAHGHVHDPAIVEGLPAGKAGNAWSPWLLFLIFVFGPCEALIPLLMYPAASANFGAIVLVVAAFTVATVGTMVVSVMVLVFGLRLFRMPNLHRYSHAMAGFAIVVCGLLMRLGL